jgi:hypothetical protein
MGVNPGAVTLLPTLDVFSLGAAGGLLALAITQVLPAAVGVVKTGRGPTVTGWRIAAGILVVAIFASAGGGAALIMGDVTAAKTALLYGMAWEALLGGAIQTGKAALP